jgi:RHS repeat-associated protein
LTDSSGNSVSYAYNESKGTLTSVTDPKGKTATYSYDSNTDALTGVSKTVDGSVVTNGYTYENDRLKTIAHIGFSYTFGYDALGNSTTVSAGSQTLITNSFDLRTGRLLESTYGNGHKVATDYDNLDRVATYKVWNSATGQYEVKFRYGYDASGNLGYLEDVVNSASYRYVYDLADRLVKISGSDGSSLTNGFDVNNNVSGITETGNGTTYTTSYEYDNDNRPKKVTLGSGAYGLTSYGELGRIDTSVISTGSVTWTVNYAYHSGVNGSTTARVASITNNGSAVSYTYVQNGNIETITDGTKFTKYYYNELNEVIREDNGNLNKSISYTYDAGGNILNKKEYSYTNGTLGTVLSTIAYTYVDTNWKDKLTAYNGKAISYDAIGNPLSYDGWTYTWENGRQLKSLSNASTSLSFKYNSGGVRTEKTVNGVTTKYTVFGDKVSFETTGSDKIHYSYDASGNLFSMNLNGTEYYYVRNAQGDITGLIDGAKNQVVSYTYDTWGKLLSTSGSLAGTLGVKNPYRYRGYRYDTETGLYYLQSRYYNPDWGRFVNADDAAILEVDQDSLIENNLFIYAMNNPVNMADSTGFIAANIAAGLIGAGAGFIIAGSFSAATQYYSTGRVDWNVAGINAISGALSGALTASGATLLASVLGNAGISMGTYVSEQYYRGEIITGKGLKDSAFAGALSGVIGGKGANGGKMITTAKSAQKSIARELRRVNQKYAAKQIAKISLSQSDIKKAVVVVVTRYMIGTYSSHKANSLR